MTPRQIEMVLAGSLISIFKQRHQKEKLAGKVG